MELGCLSQFIQLDRDSGTDHWVTINGAHVDIKGGKAVAGPAGIRKAINRETPVSSSRTYGKTITKPRRKNEGEHPEFVARASTTLKNAIRGVAGIPDEKIEAAKKMFGADHPLVKELSLKNRQQYIAPKTREAMLDDWKDAKARGTDVAKPKHGSELGFRADREQKQFERYLDAEYEKKHGVLDENDMAAPPKQEIGHGIFDVVPTDDKEAATKASIERRLIENHEAINGEEPDEEQKFGDLRKSTTYHGEMPGELKTFLQGRSHLRKYFKRTDDPAKAGFADAFGEHGDKFLEHFEQRGQSRLSKAIDTAKRGQDPEMKFLAAVMENAKPEGTSDAEKAVNADRNSRGESAIRKTSATSFIHMPVDKLQPGHSFTINGEDFSVERDADDNTTIHGPQHYPDLPAHAGFHIPIDKGSLKRRKETEPMKEDEFAPFSRGWLAEHVIMLSQGNLFGGMPSTGGQSHLSDANKPASKSSAGRWVTIRGVHVHITNGTIDKGPKSLVGKKEGDHKIDAEHGEKHPVTKTVAGPEKHEEPKPPQDVDNSRQLGLYAKNAKGEPEEIGQAPGQAALFGNDVKPVAKAAPVAKAEAEDPGQMKIEKVATPDASLKRNERIKKFEDKYKNATDAELRQIAQFPKSDNERHAANNLIESRGGGRVAKAERKSDPSRAKPKAGKIVIPQRMMVTDEQKEAINDHMVAAAGELADAGYAREHRSDSGSMYFKKEMPDGSIHRIRISDHEVPETAERKYNAESGGMSWANSDWQVVVSRSSSHDGVLDETRSLISAANRQHRQKESAPSNPPAQEGQLPASPRGDKSDSEKSGASESISPSHRIVNPLPDPGKIGHLDGGAKPKDEGAKEPAKASPSPDAGKGEKWPVSANDVTEGDIVRTRQYGRSVPTQGKVVKVGRTKMTIESDTMGGKVQFQMPINAISHIHRNGKTHTVFSSMNLSRFIVEKQQPGWLSKYVQPMTDIVMLSACEIELANDDDTGGLRKTMNGEKVHYYWAPSLKVGKWTLPSGKTLDATTDMMDRMVSNLHACLSRAVEVPVVRDHKVNAENAVGFVADAKRDGDTLYVLHGFVGDHAADTARKNKISLGIARNYSDSFGNRYTDAIHHSALTPRPVIHGLGDMVAA